VKGWSYDEDFNEGRKAAILAIRAQYQKRYFAEFSWTSFWGGTYNVGRDRDVAVLSAGVTF